LNQRLENLVIGLMFVCWAIMRVASADQVDRWTAPQFIPAILHLVVAVLFLRRGPVIMRGDTVAILSSFPSFIVGGFAINLAPAPHLWPLLAQVMLAVGAAGAVTGMIFLGRSFAIFPALRAIVNRGPFRLVRHPIYFCELLMIAGCCAAIGLPRYWAILPIGVLAVALRIIWEEKVLSESSDYESFRQTVKYRLMPGVW
jgi:protein-S-isoprenylcysteine O-methyltransferase Ste14